MKFLFTSGLLLLVVVFCDKLSGAYSGQLIDLFIALQMGFLVLLYVVVFFKNSKLLRQVVAFFLVVNLIYFSCIGILYPLGGWLFSLLNFVFYSFVFGLPIIWIYKSGRRLI